MNESLPTGGITISHEVNAAEGAAELDVLKAILNREGYLNRVAKSARTVHKKFKPEVADILDLIRAASIDVCEAIIRWREVKQDHDAAFMWNNVNVRGPNSEPTSHTKELRRRNRGYSNRRHESQYLATSLCSLRSHERRRCGEVS